MSDSRTYHTGPASDATVITKAAFPQTPYVDPDPLLSITSDVWEHYKVTNEQGFTGSRLKFHSGQVIRTSEFNALFAAATFVSITPDNGPAAGGTDVTIKGTNLRGVTGVTFDGVAATNFEVVDDETITCTTPANTAGTSDIVLADDNANVTETAGFTFA